MMSIFRKNEDPPNTALKTENSEHSIPTVTKSEDQPRTVIEETSPTSPVHACNPSAQPPQDDQPVSLIAPTSKLGPMPQIRKRGTKGASDMLPVSPKPRTRMTGNGSMSSYGTTEEDKKKKGRSIRPMMSFMGALSFMGGKGGKDPSIDTSPTPDNTQSTPRTTSESSSHSPPTLRKKATGSSGSAEREPQEKYAASEHSKSRNNTGPVIDPHLLSQPYYFGYASTKEIEGFLKKDGDFLASVSCPEGLDKELLCIVIRFKTKLRFFPVNRTKSNKCFISCRAFESLPVLVHYYTSTRECLHKELPITMKNPINAPSWFVPHDKLLIKGRLGRGQYGKVYKALIQGETEYVAVKTYKSNNANTKEGLVRRAAFVQEAELMRHLKHDNIIAFVALGFQQEPLMLILEFAPNGSLLKFLRGSSIQISKAQYAQFATEAAAGLRYLDKHQYIHRDVAARNCLLANNSQLKIADFGLTVESNGKPVVEGGLNLAIKWVAPEILIRQEFSTKTDVWAYGVLLYEIYADGGEPYVGMKNAEVRKGLIDGSQLRMEAPPTMPSEVVSLMKTCWLDDPSTRPTFKQIHKNLLANKEKISSNKDPQP